MKKSIKAFVFSLFMILACTACGHQTNDIALKPTGYPSGEVQRITVCYQGARYLYTADGFDKPLEDGFEKVGEVRTVNNQEYSQEDFAGTRLEIGQEIYANPQDLSRIYVKYTDGYGVFEKESSAEEDTQDNAEVSTEPLSAPLQEDGETALSVRKITDQELEVTIFNGENQNIIYGDDYELEKYEETSGTWNSVQPILESYGFHAIGYEVKSGETSVWQVDYTWIYGKLENGNYRIAKRILLPDREEITAYGEFEIRRTAVDPEIEACIMEKMEGFEEECTLTDLWFDEEKEKAAVDSYMRYGRGAENGVKRENVRVVFSDLKTGEDVWSFEKNTLYPDWKWILVRDGEHSEWVVDDYGN